MSKLICLREYFSIEQSAKHLSAMFKEEVTLDDIYHLAQENKLVLSLYFPEAVFGLKMAPCELPDAKVAIWQRDTFKGQTARYIVVEDKDLPLSSKVSIRRYIENKELTKQDQTNLNDLYKDYPKKTENGESMYDGHYFDYEGDAGSDGAIEYLNNEVTQVDGLWDLPILWSNDIAIKKRLEKPHWSPKTREASEHGFVVLKEHTKEERKAEGNRFTYVQLDRFENTPPKIFKELNGSYPHLELFPMEGSLVIKATELIRLITSPSFDELHKSNNHDFFEKNKEHLNSQRTSIEEPYILAKDQLKIELDCEYFSISNLCKFLTDIPLHTNVWEPAFSDAINNETKESYRHYLSRANYYIKAKQLKTANEMVTVTNTHEQQDKFSYHINDLPLGLNIDNDHTYLYAIDVVTLVINQDISHPKLIEFSANYINNNTGFILHDIKNDQLKDQLKQIKEVSFDTKNELGEKKEQYLLKTIGSLASALADINPTEKYGNKKSTNKSVIAKTLIEKYSPKNTNGFSSRAITDRLSAGEKEMNN